MANRSQNGPVENHVRSRCDQFHLVGPAVGIDEMHNARSGKAHEARLWGVAPLSADEEGLINLL